MKPDEEKLLDDCIEYLETCGLDHYTVEIQRVGLLIRVTKNGQHFSQIYNKWYDGILDYIKQEIPSLLDE